MLTTPPYVNTHSNKNDQMMLTTLLFKIWTHDFSHPNVL